MESDLKHQQSDLFMWPDEEEEGAQMFVGAGIPRGKIYFRFSYATGLRCRNQWRGKACMKLVTFCVHAQAHLSVLTNR